MRKGLIQVTCPGCAHPNLDVDAGLPQPCDSLAVHLGIRIGGRHHHSHYSCLDEGLRTGPGAPGVTARLQCDICRRPSRFAAGSLERHDLRVIQKVILVEAFADDSLSLDQHAAHNGIWRCQADGTIRQFQSLVHPVIVVVSLGRILRHRCRGWIGHRHTFQPAKKQQPNSRGGSLRMRRCQTAADRRSFRRRPHSAPAA